MSACTFRPDHQFNARGVCLICGALEDLPQGLTADTRANRLAAATQKRWQPDLPALSPEYVKAASEVIAIIEKAGLVVTLDLTAARTASEAVTIDTLAAENRALREALEARRNRESDPNVAEFMLAVAGEGPRAYEWTDKPHRLIYDLVAKVEAAHVELATLRAQLADMESQRDQALYARDTARVGGYRDVGI